MSTTEARHSSTKNGLYSEFCRTKSQTKPKIKEIITLAAKNLLDLTSCLVQIHKSINHPKYSSLSISKILDYEIESWHNELLSCGLSTRRNLSRLMTDLKYMLSSINGTEALFMDISKVTKIMKKNWDREMYKRTGNELKSNMLDIVLLIDPQIKGEDVQEENYELINRRISQLTDQTKSVFQEQLGGFRGVSQVTGRTDNSGYQSTVYDIERRDQVKQLVRETAEKDKHCHPAPSQASVSRNDSKDRLRYRLNEQLNQGTSGGLSSHGMSNMAYDTENSDFRVGASSIMSKVGSNNLKNRKFLIQQKKASNTTSQSSLRMPSLHKQRSHKVFSPNTVINSQATSVYRLDQFVIDDDREPRDIKKPVVTESISNPMATNSGYVQDKSKNSTPKKLLNKSLIGDRIVTPDPDSKKIAKPNPNCVYQPKPGALKVVTNQILNSGKKIGHNRSKKKIVSENIRSSKDLPHVFHNAVGQRENQENYPQISFQEKGYAEHSGFDLNKSSINKQHLAARENQRKAKALFESKATFGPIDRGSYLENDQNLQKSMLAVGIDPRSNNNSGQTLIGSSGMSFNHHISSGASSSHQNHLIQKIEVKGISQDGHSHPRQKEFQDENYDYANKTKVKSRSEWPKKASKSPTDSRILETNGSYNNCYKQPGGSQGVYRPGESRFGGRNGASYGNLHHPRPTEFRTATELQANPRSTEKCRGGLNHPHDRPCRPQDRIHNYEEPSQHPEPRTSNCFHKKRNPDLKGSRVLSEARHVNQNLSKVYFNSKENLGGDLVGHSMRYINKYQLANDELVSQPYHPSSTPNKVDKQFGNFSTLTPLRYSNNSLSPFSLEMKRKMIKETNFDIKKFLGNRDSEKIHVNLKGIQKVVLSNDQQYLIFGGEGLNVLDMRDDNFRIVRHDKHKRKSSKTVILASFSYRQFTQPFGGLVWLRRSPQSLFLCFCD